MTPKKQQEANKQIELAQMTLVERALVGMIEELDGRVPSDEEALRCGVHVWFVPTPLTVVESRGFRFSRYYVWRGKDAIALGFAPQQPLELHFVRLAREEWPPALRHFITGEAPP